ncbi:MULTISPECIES: TadE/TadG family type IV pilus assembly protein [Mesorhizobium]|uniref:Pilus assembly protein n=1 Tax=Mesorhizobium denitrificans TaxID=2294114 RepID=A0A371XK16_9HYPH|nr:MULTISPECIES: TadE/TadG family type IV pilus assembly protein [Mesorhizobium]RFC69565.1 pilus assembly protein [Mesorhizobium denitrificans]
MMTKTGSGARARGAKRCFLLRRYARNSDGTTAVEFGLLAVPFLMALFAILESGVSMAVQQLLVNATDSVARQVRTGEIKATTQTQLKQLICNRIQSLVPAGCPGLRVDLRTYATFQAAANQVVTVLPNDVALEMNGGGAAPLKAQIGGAGAKQTLRTFYFWPLMTNLLSESMGTAGSGRILLGATQTWQNEVY